MDLELLKKTVEEINAFGWQEDIPLPTEKNEKKIKVMLNECYGALTDEEKEGLSEDTKGVLIEMEIIEAPVEEEEAKPAPTGRKKATPAPAAPAKETGKKAAPVKKEKPPKVETYSRVTAVCEALKEEPKTVDEWVKLVDAKMIKNGGKANGNEDRFIIRYLQKMAPHFTDLARIVPMK